MSGFANEVWKAIDGFSPYEVSNMGRVRNQRTGTIRALRTSVLGYKQITLYKCRKCYCFTIHRLVSTAFLGTPPAGLGEVNHKNGIKSDNRVTNLEWTTRSLNMSHAWGKGLMKRKRNGRAKLDDDSVLEIRSLIKAGYSALELSSRFGVSRSTIYLISSAQTWKHLLKD